MKPKLLAQVVTNVLSPPVFFLLGMLVLLGGEQIRVSISSEIILVLAWFYFLMPVFYLVYLVKRGQVGDWWMSKREERYRFYLFSLGCWFLGLIYLANLEATFLFKIFLVFTLLALLFTLINFRLKISGHVGSAMVFFLTINLLNNWVFWKVIFLLPMIAWSRLYLKKHNGLQVAWAVLVPLVFVPGLMYLLDLF